MNNPIMVLDNNGLSDYFNIHGQYLGSDGTTDDYIRIISKEAWESVKTKDERDNIIIDSKKAFEYSLMFSQANLDTEATLNIYENYNHTGYV